MDDLWNIAFTICGLGAIGAFVFFSLYKQWLALPIFPKLTKKQAFILFLVFLSFTFCGLIALLITYVVTEQRQETIREQNVRIDDLVTGREQLQEALNQANRQSQQLALGVAETRGQALAVATEDPTVKMLAAKLRTTLDQFKGQTNLNELSEIDDLQVRLTEATVANVERQYARSLKLVTEDDALTEQLITEAQIEREVSVQRVRGNALNGQRRWPKALECFTRIHQLRPDDIDALNSLGQCNQQLARYDTAKKQFLQCIEKQEEKTGLHSMDTAPYYSNLATIEQDLGNLSEARSLMQKALAIYLERLGTDHVATRAAASWLDQHASEVPEVAK